MSSIQNPIKLIIVGGRNFNDFDLVRNELDKLISELDCLPIIIVSGGAKGVDALGERYARDNMFDTQIFNANWAKYERSARNPMSILEAINYNYFMPEFYCLIVLSLTAIKVAS